MCRLPLLIATPEQLQQINNNNNTHQTTDGQHHCQTSFSSASSSSNYYQQATADDRVCNSTTPNSDCSAATTATSTFLAKYFSHQPAALVATEDDKEDVEIVKKNEEPSAQSPRVEERREHHHHPNLLLFNSLQSTIAEKQQQQNNNSTTNPEELPSSCPSLMEMSPGNGLIKPETKVQRTQWLQHETATLRQKFAPEFKQIIPSVAECLRRAVDSAPKAVSNEHQKQYALFETPVDLVHDTAAAANPSLYFECFLEYLTFEALLSPSTVIGAFVLLDRLLLKLGGGASTTEISPTSSISDDVTSASASSAGSGFFRNRLFNEIQHSRSSCSATACDSKRLYLTGFNTPKLFATATRIASKILEHSTVTNTHFAEAARVFPKTLLSMEARFLELLEWDCHISTEDFTRYAECLQNDYKKKFQQAEEKLKLKKLIREEEQQQLVELDEPKMLVEIVSAAENDDDDDDDEDNLSIVSVEDEEEENTDNKQRTPLQTLEGNAAGFDSTSSMLSVQSTVRGVSSEHVVVMNNTKNSTATTRLLDDDDDNLSIDSSSDCENPLFAANDEQVFGMDSFIDSPPPQNHQNQKEHVGLAAPSMAMVTFIAEHQEELPDLLTPPMLPEHKDKMGIKTVHSVSVVVPDEIQVRW